MLCNIHSALNRFLQVEEYNICKAYVFSNNRETSTSNGITYLPIYYVMFLQQSQMHSRLPKLPH